MFDTNQWKLDWLQHPEMTVLPWEVLAERQGNSGHSEQDFWRSRRRGQPYTDDELVEQGALVKGPDDQWYHIAYLPWAWKSGEHCKASWDDTQWSHLSQIIGETKSAVPSLIGQFAWQYLTIPSNVSYEFIRQSATKCYFYGDLAEVAAFHSNKLRGNLIDGDCFVHGGVYDNTTVLGRLRVANRPISIRESRIIELIGEQNLSQDPLPVEIRSSEICELKLNAASTFELDCTSVGVACLSNGRFGKIKIEGSGKEKISLHLDGARVSGRCEFAGVEFKNDFWDDERNFLHAKFEEKVSFAGVKFQMSLLADVQLNGPVDIRFYDAAIEDEFEDELSSLKRERDFAVAEEGRRRLESACQIISERHRQDGRKDLEHRFRRMEIVARAKRKSADISTKVLNYSYGRFSDFGRSIWRPFAGLVSIAGFFGLIYLVAACLRFGDAPNMELVTDAALLASDKMFPFGTSVSEEKLFDGLLLGVENGFYGLFVGVAGAFQTIFSGIMFFLVGLAVRTKLLIG